MKIVLFDIDGTLIQSGGAGLRSLARAFEEVFEVAHAFEHVPTAGRIDPLIVRDCAAHARLGEIDDERMEAFCVRYFELLRAELRVAARQRVLPGIRELLDALSERREVGVGLLTGNFSRSARIKLEHFSLMHHFAWGAFGEDGPTRNDLLPVALTRAEQHGWRPASTDDVLVIGDTPLDVECAHVHGAHALAVATGLFARSVLDTTGAEIVVDDLTDMTPVMEWVERGI